MRRTNTFILCLSLLVAGCHDADVEHSEGGAAACAVATSVMETLVAEQNSRPFVFQDQESSSRPALTGVSEALPRDPEMNKWLHLVQRLEESSDRNAVARCSSVRTMLDRHRIGYGSRAVAAVLPRNPEEEEFGATIYSISLPLLSADGQRAVLEHSARNGRLDGGGSILLLERQPDGKWKQSNFIPTWVS